MMGEWVEPPATARRNRVEGVGGSTSLIIRRIPSRPDCVSSLASNGVTPVSNS